MSYNNIMRQYGDEWRVRRCDDGIYVIKGRWGDINPYDEAEEFYMASCDFSSGRQKNARLQAAAKVCQGFSVTQEGDTDACFIFHKNPDTRATLERLKGILGLYHRRTYPDRKLSGAALKASTDAGERK